MSLSLRYIIRDILVREIQFQGYITLRSIIHDYKLYTNSWSISDQNTIRIGGVRCSIEGFVDEFEYWSSLEEKYNKFI